MYKILKKYKIFKNFNPKVFRIRWFLDKFICVIFLILNIDCYKTNTCILLNGNSNNNWSGLLKRCHCQNTTCYYWNSYYWSSYILSFLSLLDLLKEEPLVKILFIGLVILNFFLLLFTRFVTLELRPFTLFIAVLDMSINDDDRDLLIGRDTIASQEV